MLPAVGSGGGIREQLILSVVDVYLKMSPCLSVGCKGNLSHGGSVATVFFLFYGTSDGSKSSIQFRSITIRVLVISFTIRAQSLPSNSLNLRWEMRYCSTNPMLFSSLLENESIL